MSRVSVCFGDSGLVDFNSIKELTHKVWTEESLKDKIEDVNEMLIIADELIKLEKYTAAKMIEAHIKNIDEVKKLLQDKAKAASEEKYELAMQLRDEINTLKSQLMTVPEILALFSDESETKHQPTLRHIINQVIYRVDDSFATYFVNEFIEKYERIDSQDYISKIKIKHQTAVKALALLKISKIGLNEFKSNCEELVPLLVKEIEENLLLLNEIK